MTSLQAQSPDNPAAGAYIQPSPGVAVPGVVPFRDTQISVQGQGTQTGPAATTVIATCTPGVAGLWEVTAQVSISGVSVIAVESNNMALYQTATAKVNPIPSPSTVAGVSPPVTIPSVILNLSATDTVNVKALANATATAIYAANIVCKLLSSTA